MSSLTVYGVELVTILKLQQMKIPNVVRECISEVEARGKEYTPPLIKRLDLPFLTISLGMESLGIYRMSGKVEEISSVKESFNSGIYEHRLYWE